jgi:AraC-like DNA-binding protein
MNYRSFSPAPLLRQYIERYWLLTGSFAKPEAVNLLPDGGIGLILNLGEKVRSANFGEVGNEGIYMVGTMLRSDEQVLLGECRLLGIQFRPGAFMHFYSFEPLHQFANRVLEVNRGMFPDVNKTIQHFLPYVDQFYLDRLKTPRNSIVAVASDIERLSGQVKIGELAKRHFTTERQLERRFGQHIGISPKEFINLTRFKFALGKIQCNPLCRSLAEIAWDCGYYDHAHLTNDFKRYTDTVPTGFILSDFSKSMA